MAINLELKFNTAAGEKTFTFKNVKGNASTANVKALIQGIIANGDIYRYVPLSISSAKLVTTSETIIDITD